MTQERLTTPEVPQPIKKLFIAQRGEIALRAAKTCERRGIAAVVPYTFADSNSLASGLAQAHLQDGWELAAMGGTKQEDNFTNRKKVLETALLHGCDAIFLGYGFLSEDTEFVRMCEEADIRVLAPPSHVMEQTGNKISAREVANRVRIRPWFGTSTIPVLEGSDNLQNAEQAFQTARDLGYPVMLKDPDLGGGTGNIVARNEKELEAAYTTLKTRPKNTEVFMERYVQNAVHVEVQIVADKHGNVVSLGERDCTMQRRSQKVIEESPSPHISDRLRGVLQQSAVRFAQAVNYSGIGTWEFIVDLDRKGRGGDPAWYFMEVNPRIQVEHPVTEMQTGVDIVGIMIDIAEGRKLSFTQDQIKPQGYSIEARVYAENPDRNFEKSSGLVSVLKYPEIEGVRIDPGAEEGETLSSWYDHTLFKAIAHGDDRETAREKLERVLAGTQIVGVSSNLYFLTELLNTPQFREGQATTTFAEDWWRKRLRDRVHSIAEFINGGTFTEYQPSQEYNPTLLPQTSTVIRRDDNSAVTYADHLERLKREKGTTSAATYGIQEREGVRWVLYTLDYDINSGTLGPQEGNIFVDACKLAHDLNLPLVTLCSSAGVDNWTNTLGLHQMGRTVAAVTKKYPPRFHINVNHGPVYGGVPASFAGVADVQIMVDSAQSNSGLTGIFLVAKGLGIDIPENTRATEIYRILSAKDPKYNGLHAPITHYQGRSVDILAVGGLEEASNKVTHLIHNLNLREAIVDRNRVYQPREQISLIEGSSEAMRFDRPGSRFPVWFSPVSRFREMLLGRSQGAARRQLQPLTNDERWRMIREVDRPTAAELLDTRFGMFDDTVLLSGPVLHFGEDELYPSIIAATARIADIPLLVIAQQTSRTKDEITNRLIKKYIPQKPEDWEYVEHILLGIGLKNRLPVLYIVDTEGADAGPESEFRRQTPKIAHIQRITNDYPYPSISLLLGLKGSGGGEALFRPMDGAAAAQHSLAWVAIPTGKSWIQAGHWLDDSSEEFKRYINGEKTAQAEEMLRMGLIDNLIEEGIDGAHRNPRLFATNTRSWVHPTLNNLLRFSIPRLENWRWERSEKPSQLFNR